MSWTYVEGSRRVLRRSWDSFYHTLSQMAASCASEWIRCLTVDQGGEDNIDEEDSAGDGPTKVNSLEFFETLHPRLVAVSCGFAKDLNEYPVHRSGKYGEDAWFKSSTVSADALGVADGVGGWRLYGIDPGAFSMFLMRSCERLSRGPIFDAERPDLLLSRAYCNLLEQKKPVLGSCTACIMTLRRENSMLYVANMGDSGFMVVRRGQMVCRSTEQQHAFNTPYQLSAPPPGYDLNALSDSPEMADTLQFGAIAGDVILLATDGVFDNVPEELLVEVLSDAAGIASPSKLQMLANTIALMARSLGFNPDHDSPFSQNARRQNIDAPGGKPDDITVLLASVV